MLELRLLRHLRLCNFIKKSIQHRCSSVKVAKFLRTSFFIEQLKWQMTHNAMPDESVILPYSAVYSEPSRKYKRRCFEKKVNSWKPLTMFEKRPILDVRQGSYHIFRNLDSRSFNWWDRFKVLNWYKLLAIKFNSSLCFEGHIYKFLQKS